MNLTKLLNDVNTETNEMFIMNPKLKTFDWKYGQTCSKGK
jgi:hypothetical protein